MLNLTVLQVFQVLAWVAALMLPGIGMTIHADTQSTDGKNCLCLVFTALQAAALIAAYKAGWIR